MHIIPSKYLISTTGTGSFGLEPLLDTACVKGMIAVHCISSPGYAVTDIVRFETNDTLGMIVLGFKFEFGGDGEVIVWGSWYSSQKEWLRFAHLLSLELWMIMNFLCNQ